MELNTFCAACNEYHNKRTTDQHLKELPRVKRPKVSANRNTVKPDPTHYNLHGGDFGWNEHDMKAEDSKSLWEKHGCPPAWTAKGLSLQLFYVCSYFMYVAQSQHLSSSAKEMLFPLLVCFAPELADISISQLEVLLGLGPHVVQYAVCPKCASLKTFAEFDADPVCRVPHFGNPCDEALGKQIPLLFGSKQIPKRVMAYNGIRDQLQQLFARPGFTDKLERWRSRDVPSGTFTDVYDGRVWANFQSYEGRAFLSSPGNIALQLNFDGFQPWRRRIYSCDAVYLCIMNLPRNERYKKENCILVALIPPHCSGKGALQEYLRKHAMDQLLAPLVDELKLLWHTGVDLCDARGKSAIVRAALLNVSCDLPAMRKLCGFMFHGARQGCSKCSTDFDVVESKDSKSHTVYSGNGFDTDDWPRRTNATHRIAAREEAQQLNPTRAKDLAKRTGARWSILLELPYFDPCTMAVIGSRLACPMFFFMCSRLCFNVLLLSAQILCTHSIYEW
jgi:hypothetical protein